MSDIKIQATNDIKSDESAEPQMTAETYRFVMGWDHYPESVTGERLVKLDLHVRLPFSAPHYGDACLLPTYTQKEPVPGAGFCEGNNYGKKPKPGIGEAASRVCWQTQSSKEAWNEHAEQLQ